MILVLALPVVSLLMRPPILYVPSLPQPPVSDVATPIAFEVGLTPESLAAAGASVGQAQEAVATLTGSEESLNDILVKQAAFEAKSSSFIAAESSLQAEPGNPEAVAARDAAQVALDEAWLALTGARAAALSVALSEAPIGVAQAITTSATNLAWQVPASFRVLVLEPEEWTLIETALRVEARSNRLGAEVPSEHADLLAAVRSEPTVALAQANLDAGLPAMMQMMDQVN